MLSSCAFRPFLGRRAQKWRYTRWTGSGEAWSVFYYMFSFLKGTLLFVVILLIGSGWSFLKPFLSLKEKKVIFIVLILQILDNIAIVVVSASDEGTRGYVTWTNFLHLVDIACCCAVMFPIIWQIRRLEEAVAADEVSA